MGHDRGPDHAGRETPGSAVRILADIVAIEKLDPRRAGEVLAEHVARASLERLLVAHHGFDGPGPVGTGEFLGVGFAALDDRDCEPILRHQPVALETGRYFLGRLRLGGVERMGLLPKEFRRAEEQACSQLPADHVVPQVHQQGQIAVGLDPVLHAVGDDRLARGSDRKPLVERLTSGVGNPCDLRVEALDVLGFLFEEGLGNEEREVDVAVARSLDVAVKFGLHRFPDRVAVGSDDHAAANRRVVGQFCLQDNVVIPARKVLGLTRDAGYETLLGHAFLLRTI